MGEIRSFVPRDASFTSYKNDSVTIPLPVDSLTKKFRQRNFRYSPKKSMTQSKRGHYEQDGIKTHGISVKIDNNTPENTSQTKESEWGHVICQYCGLRHHLHCKN